jgi:hypothetical protein
MLIGSFLLGSGIFETNLHLANAAVGSLTVTSPNGGENWVRGTTQMITWTKSGSPGSYVKIEVLKANVVSRILSAKSMNDGSYGWVIPSTQTLGTDYKIRVTSTTYSTVTDSSNANFAITVDSPTVTSPTPTNAVVYFKSSFTTLKTDYPAGTPYDYGYDKDAPVEVGRWIANEKNDYGRSILRNDPTGSSNLCMGLEELASSTAIKKQIGLSTSSYYETVNGLPNPTYDQYRKDGFCYINFDIYFPSSFTVNDPVGTYATAMIWQLFGSPQTHTSGGPQMMLQFSETNSNFYLYIFPWARATGTSRTLPIAPKSDFLAGGKYNSKWVHVSIYYKPGSAFKVADGTIKIWLDDELVFSRNDIETAQEDGTLNFAWSIVNYGISASPVNIILYYKNVVVSNKRWSGGVPVNS